MDNYFLMAGVLLNATLIVINRFWVRLPNWIQIPLLLVGIGLMITGMLTMGK